MNQIDTAVFTVYSVNVQKGNPGLQIYINNRNGVPIYEQVMEQIKEQILKGDLLADEALPSIRGLAKDLKISVITTKRAYEELERSGFVYMVPGKGCYVARQNDDLRKEEYLKKMENAMDEIWKLASYLKMSKEEDIEMFSVMWEEEKE